MEKIKTLKIILASATIALTTFAHAGPRVDITFKNNSNLTAFYDMRGSSAYSYAEAMPKPLSEVKAGEVDVYGVAGQQSSDATTVSFQYSIGAKTCKFKTSYVKLPGRTVSLPKWNKSAEASGGATCDVRVTNVNMSSHDWAIEFTMR